jgi:putative nucleotidyltransferase with HDIG domain
MKNIVKKSLEFPPLKQSIQQALVLIEDLEVPVNSIANVIAQDGSFASTVLKLANSPFYGVSKKVVSISEAVVLLGRFSLKNVILSLAFNEKLTHVQNIPINREELWDDSLLAGCIARELTDHINLNRELALTIGILHKIGKLVLAWADPDRYQQVLDFQAQFEEPDYIAERKMLLHDHAEIGQKILLSWKVPEEIAYTIGQYTAQYSNPSDKSAALLALSSLASEVYKHDHKEAFIESQRKQLMKFLELSPERLDHAVEQALIAKKQYQTG